MANESLSVRFYPPNSCKLSEENLPTEYIHVIRRRVCPYRFTEMYPLERSSILIWTELLYGIWIFGRWLYMASTVEYPILACSFSFPVWHVVRTCTYQGEKMYHNISPVSPAIYYFRRRCSCLSAPKSSTPLRSLEMKLSLTWRWGWSIKTLIIHLAPINAVHCSIPRFF